MLSVIGQKKVFDCQFCDLNCFSVPETFVSCFLVFFLLSVVDNIASNISRQLKIAKFSCHSCQLAAIDIRTDLTTNFLIIRSQNVIAIFELMQFSMLAGRYELICFVLCAKRGRGHNFIAF